MAQDMHHVVTREQAIAHWRRVLATSGLPPISYDSARGALRALGVDLEAEAREPGGDDE